MFPWKPTPLQSSRFSLESLLLPPRSALEYVPFIFTNKLDHILYALLHVPLFIFNEKKRNGDASVVR
jgi:hypothetical protein